MEMKDEMEQEAIRLWRAVVRHLVGVANLVMGALKDV